MFAYRQVREARLTRENQTRPLDDDRAGHIAKLRVFTDEIPTLAPAREIRMLFDSFPQREERKLADTYTVTITYEGERGHAYVDEMILDLSIYRNIEYITEHTIHDVHKQLKRIADAVDGWGAGLGHGSGILVVTRDDKRKDRALARRHFRARPEASFAPREASERTMRWTLRRVRERASRALASASERVDPGRS